MRLHSIILATAATFASTAAAIPSFFKTRATSAGFTYGNPKPFGFFVNNTVYQPTGRESIAYPRYVELDDGTILLTGSLFGNTPGYFPIFETKDGGATWKHISNLTATVDAGGAGFSAHPDLTVLTEPIGDYPAGTILGAGSVWGNFTRLDIYASKDHGRTWEFVSHAVEGGAPGGPGTSTPVWEPFLLQYEGQIVIYYSDQRDLAHDQKLCHQTTTDLKTWSSVVEDVVYENKVNRPGMTIVTYVPPVKKWVLVHEMFVEEKFYGTNYPTYYVMADSPLEFRKSVGRPVLAGNTVSDASPYVTWSPYGGDNGTIIVSDAVRSQVFTNTHGGAADKWEEHDTPAGATYARAIQIPRNRTNHLMFYGGEMYDNFLSGGKAPLTSTVVDLGEVLKAPAN